MALSSHKKGLSTEQIEDLIRYDTNRKNRIEVNIKEQFTKEDTLQILNAMSDGLTETSDGKWYLHYYKDNTQVFVEPITKNWPKLPCGRFNVQDTLRRLAL